MPHLVMSKELRNYKVFRFSGVVRIGRAEENDIVLNEPGDTAVSRHHACVEQRGDEYVLFDRSVNGTFVDNRKIEHCLLTQGTAFQIIDYVFTFVDDSAVKRIDQHRPKGQAEPTRDDSGQGTQTLVICRSDRDEETPLKRRLFDDGIIVESDTMLSLYQDVQAIAGVNVPVLILGEPGTGKEHVAHALHSFSRAPGKFVPLNCSAIPEGIFESELFGSVKGAFHNASDKPGKLELANRGTIFLDEIGDMSKSLQPKLLRFIEDKEVTRLGDTKARKISVRVVAATNQDLEAMIKGRTFRKDLYYRLACIKLEIPPLRKRKEDIVPLTAFFLSKFAKEHHWKVPGISDRALKMLMEYHWPGNIRELINVLLGVSIQVQGQTIQPSHLSMLSAETTGGREPGPFPDIGEVEKGHIIDALEKTGWNKKQAAGLLGISRNTLYRKMKQYNILRTQPC